MVLGPCIWCLDTYCIVVWVLLHFLNSIFFNPMDCMVEVYAVAGVVWQVCWVLQSFFAKEL